MMKRLRFTVEITANDANESYKRLAWVLENALRGMPGRNGFDLATHTFYLDNVKVLAKPARWASR